MPCPNVEIVTAFLVLSDASPAGNRVDLEYHDNHHGP